MEQKKASAKPTDGTYATSLGDRIARVAELVGGKKKLARRLGTYESNIYRYINGETSISARMLVDIARVGDISLEWLAMGLGDGPDPDREVNPAVGTDKQNEGALESYVRLPRYEFLDQEGQVPVATSLQIVDYVSFRRTWLNKELHVSPGNAILVQNLDDAMSPTLGRGDLLLIDSSENNLHSDSIFALTRGEQILARRVQRLLSGGVILRCDNPAYQAEQVGPDDLTSIQVLGRVVWVGKRL